MLLLSLQAAGKDVLHESGTDDHLLDYLNCGSYRILRINWLIIYCTESKVVPFVCASSFPLLQVIITIFLGRNGIQLIIILLCIMHLIRSLFSFRSSSAFPDNIPSFLLLVSITKDIKTVSEQIDKRVQEISRKGRKVLKGLRKGWESVKKKNSVIVRTVLWQFQRFFIIRQTDVVAEKMSGNYSRLQLYI